ncbi:DUF1254 domain-containing protein [Streptomyces sp. NPDC051956]|uniref:DUF1254 domain-containing protein n=1 Tax=Streptomyces sp. NPDC051956 TaxID=3365677 RepID=UPI0037D5B5CA
MAEGAGGPAADAFLYGSPMAVCLEQVAGSTREEIPAPPAAPFDAFSHATAPAGPRDAFVSVNNDTLYSSAQLDLNGGLLLRLRDTAGRYCVMQFVDTWTDHFAYLGHRATGTGAGTFLPIPRESQPCPEALDGSCTLPPRNTAQPA